MATNNADWIPLDFLPRARRARAGGSVIVAPPPYMVTEFKRAMDAKLGTFPVDKIVLSLDSGDVDVTAYYEGGASVELIKELAPDEISSGDMMLTFSNEDDTFTERDADSILYNQAYHNKRVKFYSGFELPDKSREYVLQATMVITGLDFDSGESKVNISCQDIGRRLIEETVNRKPSGMVPDAGAGNAGDGEVSDVAIMPFGTVAEDWTLTCTTPGGDAVAVFSVVGSVSGNIGNATSGTEFTTGSKIKFTISGGDVDWALNDTFTFTTPQMMEFNGVNPVKVVWSILTGYNWDTGAAESWLTRTPQFSALKSASNPDIDYASFVLAITDATFTLKGYVDWDKNLAEQIQEIILHFLGSVFINEYGQVSIRLFFPQFGSASARLFSSGKKIYAFNYRRKLEETINHVGVAYKKLDTWDWEDVDFQYDGYYTAESADSITANGRFSRNMTSRWYSPNAAHVLYFADRIVDRYQTPPFVAEFETGSDALETKIGEYIYITDAKSQITGQLAEVTRIRKDFTERPRVATLEAVFEEDSLWAFLGSSVDEGDGLSPQAADYDSASASDRRFAYVGDADIDTQPNYKMW